MKQILTLDLGGSSIKHALLSESGSFLSDYGRHETDTESADGLKEKLKELRNQYAGQYEGLAVSMPGKINTKEGRCVTAGAYHRLDGTDMKRFLEEIFEVPAVIANDGKCAAYAEAESGSLKDVANGAVIVFGTGIGGGIVLNHKVWMGSDSGAGELSWLPTDFRGIFQKNRELYTSMWGGNCSAHALTVHFADKKGIPETEMDGERFFRDLKAGDADAAEVFRDFAQQCAAGIFAMQSMLELQRFAIGGGISAEPEVTETTRAYLDELFAESSWIPCSKPEVTVCRYGNQANLIGALNFYLDQQ